MAVYLYENNDYIKGLERDIERIDRLIERMIAINLDQTELDRWRKINETQRQTLKTLKERHNA